MPHRARQPTDFNRVPRNRDMAPLIWMIGVIGLGIVAALIALVVVLLK